MNIKKIILIICAILIIICGYKLLSNQSNKIENKSDGTIQGIEYSLDEETGEYVIYNQDTGEEITRVDNEDAVQIYIDNPNYDDRMRSKDADFIDTEGTGIVEDVR